MTPLRSEAEMPAVFDAVLARLREQGPALFGSASVTLTPVAFQSRPFSHVVRIGVSADRGSPDIFCFAKIQKPKPIPDGAAHMRRRVLHEFETTLKVEQAFGGGIDSVHPIACYPDLLAIVTREVPGVTLLRYLEERIRWYPNAATLAAAEETVTSVGRWLRSFQAIDPSDDFVDLAEMRDYIDLRLQRLVSSGRSPITLAVRMQAVRHIEALASRVSPEERRSVLVHADLAPANVMVTARGIAVLDFAMASRGTFLHDLTRLVLQIGLLDGKPQFRRASVERVVAALIRGFSPEVSPEQPLFRLLSLLHRVNHLATLTLTPGSGLSRLYNSRLKAMHERWILVEIASTPSLGLAESPGL